MLTFTDPFGLCADSLHDKKGLCPGGLTDKQWDRVEYAANNRMTKEARGRVLSLLNAGKIHSGISWIARTVAHVFGVDPAAVTHGGSISISPEVFNYQPGNFAMLLAHESEHTQQGALMLRVFAERGADAYGCANTWGRSGSYFGGTYGNEFGNYCGGR